MGAGEALKAAIWIAEQVKEYIASTKEPKEEIVAAWRRFVRAINELDERIQAIKPAEIPPP